ncbi:hypothetical protein AAMO2058_001030700 [Amorphochlora amoebiformis]
MTRVIKGLVTSSVEKMRASTRAVVSLFVLNSLEYCNCVPIGVEYDEYMNSPVRPHMLSLTDFGARGDNASINSEAFNLAIARAASLEGGCRINIPPGVYLTAPFNLTSHLTLHLSKGATILGVGEERRDLWPVIAPLPSYGTARGGAEIPLRYAPLIGGFNLTDVVIEGEGVYLTTIDGNGWGWWKAYHEKRERITRGRLIEFMWSDGILIQNLTLQNSPFWTTHLIYSSNIVGRGLRILAPSNASNTDGFDPDSSENVTLVDTYISTGDDCIAIKSGWDCYGVHYGRPTKNVYIRNVTAVVSHHSAGSFSIGSEMSGGISNVLIVNSTALGDGDGLHLKTSRTRGGYIRHIIFENILIDGSDKVSLNIGENYGSVNPECGASWDPPVPVIDDIQFRNVRIAQHPDTPFKFQGLSELPITRLLLVNVTTEDGQGKFDCNYVSGKFENVSPLPCKEIKPAAGASV